MEVNEVVLEFDKGGATEEGERQKESWKRKKKKRKWRGTKKQRENLKEKKI